MSIISGHEKQRWPASVDPLLPHRLLALAALPRLVQSIACTRPLFSVSGKATIYRPLALCFVLFVVSMDTLSTSPHQQWEDSNNLRHTNLMSRMTIPAMPEKNRHF